MKRRLFSAVRIFDYLQVFHLKSYFGFSIRYSFALISLDWQHLNQLQMPREQ